MKLKKAAIPAVVDATSGKLAIGGAFEGADRTSRALASWSSPIMSPDREINRDKITLDSRGRDTIRNDGYMLGALNNYRDSIVGASYRLNSKPDYKTLGFTEEWAEKFQVIAEAKFNLYAESMSCWMHAGRSMMFTEMVRMALAQHFMAGESCASAEWITTPDRPYKTAIQFVDPDRLSNPNDLSDTNTLRRGVEIDKFGAPVAYNIREAYPNDGYVDDSGRQFSWKRVAARKPWGRIQFIHLYEALRPDQHRGVAEMVSVLKDCRMTKKFSEIVLQNAIVNATYAATIESELPREMAFAQIGEGQQQQDPLAYIEAFQNKLAEYVGQSKNIHIDGVKIPHLFPNTKLNLRPAGQVGGVGSEFEASLLRHIAAGLGISYEELSRDFSQTNYSSFRAASNNTARYMNSKKKVIADKFATHCFQLWLEEEINSPTCSLPLPKGAAHFYEPLHKEAYSLCSWIGASRGQVDELKETQAAVLRISSGLSTYEIEAARLGYDFRETFQQRKREDKIIADAGLVFNLNAQKSGSMNDAGDEDGAGSSGKKPGKTGKTGKNAAINHEDDRWLQ